NFLWCFSKKKQFWFLVGYVALKKYDALGMEPLLELSHTFGVGSDWREPDRTHAQAWGRERPKK
ncbi:MAG: hypothetical protein AAF934_04685, partial [Bacteroidota bacterium]